MDYLVAKNGRVHVAVRLEAEPLLAAAAGLALLALLISVAQQ